MVLVDCLKCGCTILLTLGSPNLVWPLNSYSWQWQFSYKDLISSLVFVSGWHCARVHYVQNHVGPVQSHFRIKLMGTRSHWNPLGPWGCPSFFKSDNQMSCRGRGDGFAAVAWSSLRRNYELTLSQAKVSWDRVPLAILADAAPTALPALDVISWMYHVIFYFSLSAIVATPCPSHS